MKNIKRYDSEHDFVISAMTNDHYNTEQIRYKRRNSRLYVKRSVVKKYTKKIKIILLFLIPCTLNTLITNIILNSALSIKPNKSYYIIKYEYLLNTRQHEFHYRNSFLIWSSTTIMKRNKNIKVWFSRFINPKIVVF